MQLLHCLSHNRIGVHHPAEAMGGTYRRVSLTCYRRPDMSHRNMTEASKSSGSITSFTEIKKVLYSAPNGMMMIWW